MTSSRWHRASHRAFRTGERRDSWSGEPSGTSISSRQKARLECGFQQGGGAVSFVTRERHSLLPRHPFLEFLPPRLPCLALPCLLGSLPAGTSTRSLPPPLSCPLPLSPSFSRSLSFSVSLFAFDRLLRLAAPGAPFNCCQLPHGDLENFFWYLKTASRRASERRIQRTTLRLCLR